MQNNLTIAEELFGSQAGLCVVVLVPPTVRVASSPLPAGTQQGTANDLRGRSRSRSFYLHADCCCIMRTCRRGPVLGGGNAHVFSELLR